MVRLKINVNEIMIALNNITDDSFVINTPLYRNDLYEIDFYRNRLKKDYMKDFLSYLSTFKGIYRISAYDIEIPSKENIRDSLLKASALKIPEYPEIINMIKDLYVKSSFDNPTINLLAIDTNILYNRFLSNIENNIPEMPPILVSGCVVDEITYASSHKFDAKTSSLKKIVQTFNTLNLFKKVYSFNTPSMKARRAFIALRELEHLKNTYRVSFTNSSNCKGDKSIVQDYAKQRNIFNNIVFLTFDSDSRLYAYKNGIKSIFIRTPNFDTPEITYGNMEELIYQLLQVFMNLKIYDGNRSFMLYAMWPGKKIDEWIAGKILLETENEKIHKEILVARKINSIILDYQ